MRNISIEEMSKLVEGLKGQGFEDKEIYNLIESMKIFEKLNKEEQKKCTQYWN